MAKCVDLLQGTLNLLILKILEIEQEGWITAEWSISETRRRISGAPGSTRLRNQESTDNI